MRYLCACCALALLAGCAIVPRSERDPAAPWLGTYRGSFDSALTADPEDDLNHDPCDPELGPCETHHAPLKDVLLHIDRRAAGQITLEIYRNVEDLGAGRPLDLLGAGCGTRLGPGTAADVDRDAAARAAAGIAAAALPAAAAGSVTVLVFPIRAHNRLCLGKLRPVSRPALHLALVPSGGVDDVRQVRLVVDRNVRDANYLYVEQDGVRRRVRIDRDNTVEEDHQRRYRVCIEDDFGEYHRCVLTDREFKSFALPIPVPGGVAVSYTWWQELRPRLQRTRGRYEVTRDVGRFERLPEDS